MPSIAIISENPLRFTENDITMHSNFTYDNIEEMFEDYVTLLNVTDNDDFISTIAKTLHNEISSCYTGVVSHTENDLYQICHIDNSSQFVNEELSKYYKRNGIADYLTDTPTPVLGVSLFFRIDTTDDRNVLVDISMKNIVDIFIKKFIHQGIVLELDGTLNEFNFRFNPLDFIKPDEINFYTWYGCPIFGHCVMFLHDTREKEKNIIASAVAKHDIFGRALMAIYKYSEFDEFNQYLYFDLQKKNAIDLISIFKDVPDNDNVPYDEPHRHIGEKSYYTSLENNIERYYK